MTSAVSLQILDATLFIDCLTADVDQVEKIADICGEEFERLRAAGADVVVSDNEDDDPDRATFWPGGFVYFPIVVEIYTTVRSPRSERADVTTLLLSALWSRGCAAVAACEYEDLLPAAAGTGDSALPWPGSTQVARSDANLGHPERRVSRDVQH